MADLTEKLKNLPDQPGVYLMKDASNTIIYVGKAKILKNRVRQYFHSNKNHPPKVRAMVANIDDFEYIMTDTELEAFALEANLIKKYKPHYNILLKDDKHYPYIKITMKDPYPKLFMVRRMEKDGSRYFGPYTSSFLVREMIGLVKKIFKVQFCSKSFPRDIKKERACLYYAMGRCTAPCQEHISQEEYKKIFEDICEFLDGNQEQLVEKLRNQMQQASDALEFERAAAYRNQIDSINQFEQKQRVISAEGKDIDVIAFAARDDDVSFEIFHIRKGKMIGHETINLPGASGIDDSLLMDDFLNQYYGREVFVPELVCISQPLWEDSMLEAFLREKRGKKVIVRCPQKGEHRRLVEMAQKNARKNLEEYKLEKMKLELKKNVLHELKADLRMETLPRRIEAYDISNISGSDNVGAMVVFQDGKPLKSAYRKFKIKYTSGANDYDCMREVLFRRFRHALSEQQSLIADEMDIDDAKFAIMPDVLFIDGGKGHVSAVSEILKELDVTIPVFGMVKDDKHRTRGMVTVDGEEIHLKPSGAPFRFITHVQDEVHNTAIAYHRYLRSKKSVASELEQIKGVGQVRRKKLMQAFRTVEKIKKASLDELEQVKGIDKATAQNVYEYFHRDEKQK